MVLWEITLATAYFLGLKRTYRLALRVQRRILAPKIRQFAHRRTRAVFSVALKVNRTIQERDIAFGRNMGNYILQRLNRMKAVGQFQGGSDSNGAPHPSLRMTKLASSFSNGKTSSYYQLFKRKSGKPNTWFQQRSILSKPFPSIVKMMQSPSLARTKLASSFSNRKTSNYYQLRKSGKEKTWFQQQSIWSKPFPSIVNMMRPQSLAGTTTHCRHLNINASHAFSPNYRVNWSGDFIRKDIMQWMLRN